jgi:hypothetical protein
MPTEKARIMIRKVPFLTGAFTPLVTPFKSGAVDYDRYAKLIEWQIEQGTHGLLVHERRADYAYTGREGAADRGCGQNVGGSQAGGRLYSLGIAR